MKGIQFTRTGPATEVAEVIDLPEPSAPEAGEAIVEVQACPINPADLYYIQGAYGDKPSLPSLAGTEGAGIVAEVGPQTNGFQPGDKVLLFDAQPNKWVQKIKAKVTDLLPVPAQADIQQVAMMRVNPATAWVMLTQFVPLTKGDWMIQSAASSSVGHCVIALAKSLGVRTVNLVRRSEEVEALTKEGADIVLVEGEDLVQRIEQALGNAPIRLGIDAVAGSMTGHIAACLAEGATLLSYGMLSNQPININAQDVIFRNVSLTGFWLKRWFAAHQDKRQEVYDHLSELIVNGTLKLPLRATYPLSKAKEALANAGGKGKTLLLPNQ